MPGLCHAGLMHEVAFTDLLFELPPGLICSQELLKISDSKVEN